jgi:hypothetical protein
MPRDREHYRTGRIDNYRVVWAQPQVIQQSNWLDQTRVVVPVREMPPNPWFSADPEHEIR